MKRFTIGKKLYIFVIATVLFAVASVCAISYIINADQIDSYFKRLTLNSANAYASYVDVEFMKELREVAESSEYQAVRLEAEEVDDDTAVIEYLQDKGLWDKYVEEREEMITYVSNMTDIEYLYIVVMGPNDGTHDMYLLDADDVPFYETGYYEVREEGFAGVDMQGVVEPTISEGDWGWLCSAYVPIYDKDGNLVCHIGCDVSMEEVFTERRVILTYMIAGAFICMMIILALAIIFVKRTILSPLKSVAREVKHFSPAENRDYEEAGVINLNFKTKDEISDIYDEIHSMQIKIVDYINSLTSMKRDKERAENEAKSKEIVIDKISEEAFKDALTGIGNKNAYDKKAKEINYNLKHGWMDFAIVMVDVNWLKQMNDIHGHSFGDIYLKGCCHQICDVFKHSPVYRIGGDEFVAILYGDDYGERQLRLKELKDVFSESFANKDVEPWLRYSASVGMAICESDTDTFETVFKRADQLMYEEKQRFKANNSFE